jgi:hypothetical protein
MLSTTVVEKMAGGNRGGTEIGPLGWHEAKVEEPMTQEPQRRTASLLRVCIMKDAMIPLEAFSPN